MALLAQQGWQGRHLDMMGELGAVGVCLVLAAAPTITPRFVPVQHFTLAWVHSIEKVRWEEDYSTGFDAAPILLAGQARIKGSAAGMEPPPDAVLNDGWYTYQPDIRPDIPLRLTRSPYTPDYDWCVDGRCIPLSAIMPSDGGVTLLYPCLGPTAPDSSTLHGDQSPR